MREHDRNVSIAALGLAFQVAGGAQALASVANVSKPTVYRWIAGDTTIELSSAVRVSADTGVPLRLIRPDVFRALDVVAESDDQQLEEAIRAIVEGEK